MGAGRLARIRVRGIAGEAVEIDRDVDLHLAQQRRDLVVVLLAHVDETIERSLDPRSRFALVIGPSEMPVDSKRDLS